MERKAPPAEKGWAKIVKIDKQGRSKSDFEELVVKVKSLEKELERHLVERPENVLPPAITEWTDHDAILKLWTQENTDLNLAPKGRSTAEVLFLLRCYAHCCGRAQQPCTQDAIQLLLDIQGAGTNLVDFKFSGEDLFNRVAIFAVQQLEHAPALTLSTTRGFGFDYGSEDSIYKGDEDGDDGPQDGKAEQRLDDREIELQLKEEEALRVARAILPMSTRVFFENWFADDFFGRMDTDMEFNHDTVPVVQVLDGWFRNRMQIDLPDKFDQLLEDWIFRAMTPVGSLRAFRRDPANANKPRDSRKFFHTDVPKTTLPHQKWIQAYDKPVTLLQTPVADLAMLAAFASLLDAQFAGADFVGQHVVLRDEVFDKRDWIMTWITDSERPRRPLIIQWKQHWIIHNNNKKIQCNSIQEALAIWMLCVQGEPFRGKLLLKSTSIIEWLKLFIR
jgi:hypothetical protein